MKKVLFLALTFSVTCMTVLCQDSGMIRTSAIENSGRFEVVRPSFDGSTTFRLDKFTGRGYRLATCAKDDGFGSDKCWKEMNVIDLPKQTSVNKPLYQIVIDTQQKFIMLLQVETGRSWQYGIEPMDRWYPFVDCSDNTSNLCLWKP